MGRDGRGRMGKLGREDLDIYTGNGPCARVRDTESVYNLDDTRGGRGSIVTQDGQRHGSTGGQPYRTLSG